MTALLLVLTLSPVAAPQSYNYQGYFSGPVDLRQAPYPGYYYDPQTPVPWRVRRSLDPVSAKTFDGGQTCPDLTSGKTYLYSGDPLPGQYWYPDPGRMRPILTNPPTTLPHFGQGNRRWQSNQYRRGR